VGVTLIPALCRAARGLVGMTQADLAEKANVSLPTIKNFERGASVPYPNNLSAIVAAFDAAGVEFTNSDQPGVRLRKGRR
jgi:transcriptional regulator with XRE-family HTH domain